MADDQKTLLLKMEDPFWEELQKLKKSLGAKDETEVIRKALGLLYYAMGSELKIERKNSNQTLIFKQFQDKQPLTD